MSLQAQGVNKVGEYPVMRGPGGQVGKWAGGQVGRWAGGQVTHGVGSGEAEWSPGASVHQHDPGVAGVGHRRVGGLGVGRYTSSPYMRTMRKETNEHQPPCVQKS